MGSLWRGLRRGGGRVREVGGLTLLDKGLGDTTLPRFREKCKKGGGG